MCQQRPIKSRSRLLPKPQLQKLGHRKLQLPGKEQSLVIQMIFNKVFSLIHFIVINQNFFQTDETTSSESITSKLNDIRQGFFIIIFYSYNHTFLLIDKTTSLESITTTGFHSSSAMPLPTSSFHQSKY